MIGLELEDTPTYPDLGPKVAKLRALARHDPAYRKAHGEAVLEAVRAKQRQALRRTVASHVPPCASGTTHTDGAAILKAVAAQHLSALRAAQWGIERKYLHA